MSVTNDSSILVELKHIFQSYYLFGSKFGVNCLLLVHVLDSNLRERQRLVAIAPQLVLHRGIVWRPAFHSAEVFFCRGPLGSFPGVRHHPRALAPEPWSQDALAFGLA